jgi:mono/diheme cytochrome c family protein
MEDLAIEGLEQRRRRPACRERRGTNTVWHYIAEVLMAVRKYRRMARLAVLLAAIESFVPLNVSAQDITRGRDLAARWCANCHVVERSPVTAPADGLPTFPALANQAGQSPDHLRAAMNPQHSRMPDFALSKQQQDDLVAYILSLRGR